MNAFCWVARKLKRTLLVAWETVFVGFLLLVDNLVFWQRPAKEGGSYRKKLLVVRLDAIGDFVLWLDAARALRKIYPAELFEVTLVGNAKWTDLAQREECFDHIAPVDVGAFLHTLRYRLHILREIRDAGYQVVVNPTTSRHIISDDSVVRASGAETKIGCRGDCTNTLSFLKPFADRWYTRLIPTTKGPLMELQRNVEFMRGLGAADFNATLPSLSAGTLPQGFVAGDYFVLFPGAGLPERCWPAKSFLEIARRIHDVTGWFGVLCGGPGEETLGEIIADGATFPMRNWLGRTNLLELAAIISRAHLLIGNETSAVHIAAAVRTPSICLLGGGHFGRFIPYTLDEPDDAVKPRAVFHEMACFNCNWRCSQEFIKGEPFPCLSKISVEQVWAVVQPVLDAKTVNRQG